VRDVFALGALTGLLGDSNYTCGPSDTAIKVYLYADAVIKERAKGQAAG
jgi:hypothetical protein